LRVVGEHVERLRVAWVDTDAGGRIHFTAAFRWAEAGEHRLLRDLGLLGVEVAHFPRRHVEAEYLRVLRFDDEFELRLCAERVGHTSITYSWRIVCDGELCIAGRHTVVHVDEAGRPSPLPDGLRAALTAALPVSGPA
jgi:YbgC/YbaW family acyl-CoA thioester hydrolase